MNSNNVNTERDIALFPIAPGLKARIIIIGDVRIDITAKSIQKLVQCLDMTKNNFAFNQEDEK